jgi:hypothetical protein
MPKTISISKAAKEKGIHRNAIYYQISNGTFDIDPEEKPARIIVNEKYLNWQPDKNKIGAKNK